MFLFNMQYLAKAKSINLKQYMEQQQRAKEEYNENNLYNELINWFEIQNIKIKKEAEKLNIKLENNGWIIFMKYHKKKMNDISKFIQFFKYSFEIANRMGDYKKIEPHILSLIQHHNAIINIEELYYKNNLVKDVMINYLRRILYINLRHALNNNNKLTNNQKNGLNLIIKIMTKDITTPAHIDYPISLADIFTAGNYNDFLQKVSNASREITKTVKQVKNSEDFSDIPFIIRFVSYIYDKESFKALEVKTYEDLFDILFIMNLSNMPNSKSYIDQIKKQYSNEDYNNLIENYFNPHVVFISRLHRATRELLKFIKNKHLEEIKNLDYIYNLLKASGALKILKDYGLSENECLEKEIQELIEKLINFNPLNPFTFVDFYESLNSYEKKFLNKLLKTIAKIYAIIFLTTDKLDNKLLEILQINKRKMSYLLLNLKKKLSKKDAELAKKALLELEEYFKINKIS